MSATETTPAPTRPEYVVLRQDSQDGGWQNVDIIKAINQSEAIRGQSIAGTYVAIPARSWRPVKVRLEQVSRVILEDA